MKTAPILSALTLSLLIAANPASAQTPAKTKSASAPASATAAAAVSFKDAKLAAMDAWLNANKTSGDRADALTEAANLAFELSNWTKAKGYAEVYLKEFPKADGAAEMQLVVGRSLANTPGGEAEAKKVFMKAAADAGDNVNQTVSATMELADLLANTGDLAGAKATLHALADKFKDTPGLGDFINGKLADFEQYGKAPKPIDVTGFDGKPINLDDLKGKVVMIDFWATWCHPCMLELPNVIATYKKLHPQGFEIVGISLDDNEGKVKDFLATHDAPWAQFFDGKGWGNEIAQTYGVSSIPQTYLLDKDGNVQGVGLRGPALGRAVERLLNAKGAAKK